jgi:predicted MFS family arabinose efflux permease
VFVPKRKPVEGGETGGVLDGVRFLRHDALLGPIAAIVVAFGFLGAGMSAGLPFYAFDEFDGSSRIAGLFYAALGAGAVVGSVVAMLAVRKIAPLRLAGLAILAFIVPMWVLPLQPPWPVVTVALFVGMLFTPLINGPFFAVLTARTPEALRAKVMTAVVSTNTFAAPLGFLAAGQVLERWGLVPLFTLVASGMTLAGLSFAALARRHEDGMVGAVEPVAP